ncbi:hypothetical protein Tco_1529089 [Tanacetum coccineum]
MSLRCLFDVPYYFLFRAAFDYQIIYVRLQVPANLFLEGFIYQALETFKELYAEGFEVHTHPPAVTVPYLPLPDLITSCEDIFLERSADVPLHATEQQSCSLVSKRICPGYA